MTTTTQLLLLLSALCWGELKAAGPEKISASQLRDVHKAARLDKQ